MQRIALQRNELQRIEFFEAIAQVVSDPSQVVFADEVGQDGRGSHLRFGYVPVNERVEKRQLLVRGKHISILALYGIEGFIAFDWLEGGFKAADFMTAVEFMIVPCLQAYPLPN
jgi:hypothetical protein